MSASDNSASQTTRDDDLYNEVVRERVVSDMDEGTRIVDVLGSLSWRYRVKISWESLDRAKTCSINSIQELNEYTDLSDSELGSKLKYGTLHAPGRHNWVATRRTIVTETTTYLHVERPDNETVWVKHEETVESPSCETAALAAAYHNATPITVDRIDNGYELTVDGRTISTTETTKPSEYHTDEIHNRFFVYLGMTDGFVDAHVSNVRDDGEQMFVDITFGSETITYTFEDPKSSESGLWSLVEAFGADDDPLSIQNEDVRLAYKPFVSPRNAVHSQRLWVVADEASSVSFVTRVLRMVGLR